MPSTPGPSGLVRVRFIWNRGAGGGAQNVFYGLFDADFVTSAELNAALNKAERILTEVSQPTSILRSVTPEWSIVQMVAEDAGDPTGAQVVRTTSHPGTASGTSVPPGVASVVTWRTAKRGRSFRGRSFFPGLPEGEVGPDGEIGSTRHTVLGQGADGWRLGMAAEDIGICPPTPLQVVSYFTDGAARSTAVATPVNGNVVRDNVHSQRRRQAVG